MKNSQNQVINSNNNEQTDESERKINKYSNLSKKLLTFLLALNITSCDVTISVEPATKKTVLVNKTNGKVFFEDDSLDANSARDVNLEGNFVTIKGDYLRTPIVKSVIDTIKIDATAFRYYIANNTNNHIECLGLGTAALVEPGQNSNFYKGYEANGPLVYCATINILENNDIMAYTFGSNAKKNKKYMLQLTKNQDGTYNWNLFEHVGK